MATPRPRSRSKLHDRHPVEPQQDDSPTEAPDAQDPAPDAPVPDARDHGSEDPEPGARVAGDGARAYARTGARDVGAREAGARDTGGAYPPGGYPAPDAHHPDARRATPENPGVGNRGPVNPPPEHPAPGFPPPATGHPTPGHPTPGYADARHPMPGFEDPEHPDGGNLPPGNWRPGGGPGYPDGASGNPSGGRQVAWTPDAKTLRAQLTAWHAARRKTEARAGEAAWMIRVGRVPVADAWGVVLKVSEATGEPVEAVARAAGFNPDGSLNHE